MTELLIPLLFLAAAVTAMARRQETYAALLRGAQGGLRLLATLAPTLIVLLALVTMLRESGFFELLSAWLRPLFTRLGIPPELAPLMLIRPISGSAALAVGGRPDVGTRRRLADWADGGGHARQLGDDVLHDQRLFRRSGYQADALRHTGSALRGCRRLFLRRAVHTAVFLLKSVRFSAIMLSIMSRKGELRCKFL